MLTTGTINRWIASGNIAPASWLLAKNTRMGVLFTLGPLNCRAVRKNSGGTWCFARFGDFSGLSHKIKVEIGADTPEERRRKRFKAGQFTVKAFFCSGVKARFRFRAKKKAFTSYRKFLTKSIVNRNPARASDKSPRKRPNVL
jgi:hypothetical protein